MIFTGKSRENEGQKLLVPSAIPGKATLKMGTSGLAYDVTS
jgi:hypothetical protein